MENAENESDFLSSDHCQRFPTKTFVFTNEARKVVLGTEGVASEREISLLVHLSQLYFGVTAICLCHAKNPFKIIYSLSYNFCNLVYTHRQLKLSWKIRLNCCLVLCEQFLDES